MDSATFTNLLPLIVAGAGLAAVIINFIDGRLREAKDETAKERLYGVLWTMASLFVWLSGAACIFLGVPLFSIFFFVAAAIFSIRDFFKLAKLNANIATVALVINFCVVTFCIISALFAWVSMQLMQLETKQTEVINRLAEQITKQEP